MSLISDALKRVQQRRVLQTQEGQVGPASILPRQVRWMDRVPSGRRLVIGLGGAGMAIIVAAVFGSGLFLPGKGGKPPTARQGLPPGAVTQIVIPPPAARQEETAAAISATAEGPSGVPHDTVQPASPGQEPALTQETRPAPLIQPRPAVPARKTTDAPARKTTARAPVLTDETAPRSPPAQPRETRQKKAGRDLDVTPQREPAHKPVEAPPTVPAPARSQDLALPYFQAGLQHQRARDFVPALEAYVKAVELDPSNAAAHNNLGMVHRELGSLDAAVAQYHQALALDPTFVEARNNLGVALLSQGRLPEAVAAFHQTLSLAPNNITAYLNLGVVYKRLQRTPDALQAWQKVLALNASLPEAHYNIALLLEEEGALQEAITHFQRFLALAADKDPATTARVRKHLALLTQREEAR